MGGGEEEEEAEEEEEEEEAGAAPPGAPPARTARFGPPARGAFWTFCWAQRSSLPRRGGGRHGG